VSQIIGDFEKAELIHAHVVKVRHVVLEIIQYGHDGTFLVVGEQRLEAYVLESDGLVQSITPHCQVLNSQLKIQHLHNIDTSQTT